MSLDPAGAASLQTASSAEDKFQGLWEAGTASPAPEPAQGPSGAAPASPEQPAPAAEAAPEPVKAETPAEDAGPDYANLDDYLTKSGLERDSFYDLPVTVKIAGESKLVPLRDALRSYQQDGDYTRKTQELANQKQAWETAQAQARQVLEGQLSQAKTLGDLAHQQLLGDYQQIDWNRLRADDPSRWAVLHTEFNQRANAIQQHLAQVNAQQQKLAEEQQQQVLQRLPQEREKMIGARPEWADESKFSSARAEMTSYAQKLGFTPAEIGSIYDHRIMLALHDASRFAALQAAKPEALKRVRAAPQVANPGARISRDPAAVARTQARDAFKKNPRDQDAAARYFSQLAG